MANTNATKPHENFSDKPQGMADKPRNVGQAASDLASSVGQKASDAASTVGQKASDVASTVGKKPSDMASAVGDKADDATSAVGSGMKSLASTIREKTPELGMMGGVSGAVADTLESGGRYLQERQLSGIAEDLTDVIRRHPVPAILIGMGLGFFFARVMASSRS